LAVAAKLVGGSGTEAGVNVIVFVDVVEVAWLFDATTNLVRGCAVRSAVVTRTNVNTVLLLLLHQIYRVCSPRCIATHNLLYQV
jgi:hypothetical protein